MTDTDIRQVLVVRHDLNMRRGKLAAQAAHASMSCLTRAPGALLDGQTLTVQLGAELQAWLAGSFKKVTLYVKSETELLELQTKAQAAGLTTHLIQDSGLTEFGGVPTYTVLAIGPHAKASLDPITGHLPLY